MQTKIITRFSLLASLLTLPAACGGGSSDNGFFVDWAVEDVGPPINDEISCDEAGTTTVVLEATNLAGGIAKQSFPVPCNAGNLTTTALPAGNYQVDLRLLRSDNIEVSSIALPPVGLRRGAITDLQTVIFEIQSFQTQWLITRSVAPSVPISCAAAGATQVEFTAASTAPGAAPFVFRFPCTDGVGATQAVPDGAYALQFRLLDAAGNPLSALQMAYTTPVGARAVLPAVTFTVN